MSRLGVKHNLILCLQSLKPLKNIHSCAIRLANKKFTVDMNLSHHLDNRKTNVDRVKYFNLMGARLHGSYIIFDLTDIDDYNEKDVWNYSCKHEILNKGIKWYNYNKNDDEYGIRTEIQIIGDLVKILTPKLIKIYQYNYRNYKNTTEIFMTEDLINYSSIYHHDQNMNVYFTRSNYGRSCSSNLLICPINHETLIKILADN